MGLVCTTYKGLYYLLDPLNNSEMYKEQNKYYLHSRPFFLSPDVDTETANQLPCWQNVTHHKLRSYLVQLLGCSMTEQHLRASSGPPSSAPHPNPQPPLPTQSSAVLVAPETNLSLPQLSLRDLCPHQVFTDFCAPTSLTLPRLFHGIMTPSPTLPLRST